MLKAATRQTVSLRWPIAALACGALALAVLGLVMVYSATDARAADPLLSRQVVALVIGILGAALIVMADYQWLKRLAGPAYLGAVILLGFVLKFHAINGAHRWIILSGVRFQPSEFAKLALILALASYCANAGGAIRSFKRGILVPGLIVGGICGLIFIEPDWGTAIITGLACLVLLLVAGVRLRYLLGPGIVVAGLLGVALWQNGLRAERIYSWRHLYETRRDVGWQAYQARIAIASGGAWGVGFDRGTQQRFVPEVETDFIFAVIAEELGFAGSLLLITLYGLVLWSGVTIALRAPDRFGLLVATGITFLLAGQALCNLAVVSGLLPNKGLTLPFISKGGSSLMMAMIFVGVLLRIARATERQPIAEQQPLSLFDESPETELP